MPRTPRIIVLACLAVVVSIAGLAPTGAPASAQQAEPPNVLIILTDDQRPVDTMLPEVMPETLRRFGAEGTTYPNAVATTPLCCPARAGLMTGRFAHNNGVRTNGDPEALGDHRTTLQYYLDDAGYQTALVGKFLNQWKIEEDPPHWDRWSMMDPGPSQYTSTWNIEGSTQSVAMYSTDFAAERSVNYLTEFNAPTRDDDPWFLYTATYAPHAPYEAAPEYQNAPVPPWSGNPAVFEADKSDKPPHVRKANRDLATAQAIRDQQLRMLMSVDDLVEDIFDTLEALGELDNTIAFFASDNGFLWSDHGLGGKNEPYLPSNRIPFYARWPGRIAEGAVDDRLVANIDIAPTAMRAAGLPIPAQMDGIPLTDPVTRTKILTEAWHRGGVGGWASIITPRYQYIESYADDAVTVSFRQLYLLPTDPWQLRNVLGDGPAKNDSDIAGLSEELGAARTCGAPGYPACTDVLTSRVALCLGRETVPASHVVGGPKRDVLRGSRAGDLLCGFAGKDTLRGGRGNDQLLGGPGRDLMLGGKGRDRCVGGPGAEEQRACEKAKKKKRR